MTRPLDQLGWQQYVGRRGEREQDNHQVVRSPDLYEVSSPKEFCRSQHGVFPSSTRLTPAAARHCIATTSSISGWAPAARDECLKGFAFLNAGNDFAKQPLGTVDPERVYAVDCPCWLRPIRNGPAAGAIACCAW